MKSRQSVNAAGKIALVFAALFAAFSLQAQVFEAQVLEFDMTEPDVRYSPADEHGRYVYLIEFAEPGLLEQHRQQRSDNEKFSLQTAPMQAALSSLQASQQQHIQSASQVLGRSLDVSHYYLVTNSGIATRLSPAEASQLSRLPGVAAVERERVYEINTYRGPEFIGAGGLWDGSASPGNQPLQGEGMIAAIIDTGIVINHPSFANDAVCGHGMGEVGDKLLSALDCASTDTSGMCNGPSPHDSHSHGSHVSSTVAGNRLDSSASPPPLADISGVAPCAHVRSYNSCPGGSCPGGQLQAAMNSVLLHADVDVMNYSISGGRSPWNDNDRRKLDLVDADIFVAASAGNTSAQIPNPYGQVAHLGPWLMSVANSSHDGELAHPMSLDGGPGDIPGLPGVGPELTSDLTAPLRWAGDVAGADVEGCSAFPPGTFNGEVALIIRGNCDFATKITNARNAGADFVVVYNNLPGAPIVMGGLEGTTIPSVMVSLSDGQALIDALDGDTASLTALAGLQAYGFPGGGDVLSGGSLVGPTPAPLHNLQKPDITAPGTNIYAAGTPAGGYTYMSGTSMSSPHLAGAAVLMRQARPAWTPLEIKSALQMTASGGGFKPDGTSAWDADDVGHGRTQVSLAANAGLVMDETFDNFLAANPAQGGDVRTLNLPALREMDCTPSCSWTRTVRNTLDAPSSWSVSSAFHSGDFTVTVSPDNFTLSGDDTETQELTVTISPVGNQSANIHFGELVFSEASDQSPDLHWTLAAKGDFSLPPQAEITPAGFSFELDEGQADAGTLNIANLGDTPLTFDIGQAPALSELGGFRGERVGAGQLIELKVDDHDGTTNGVGVGDQSMIWFNRFTPTALQLPFTLQEIDLVELPSPNYNTQAGDIYDVYVWSSPDGNPASGNEVLLASMTGQVYGSAPGWVTIVLPDGGVVIDESTGDVLIGIATRTTREDFFPALSDANVVSQGRSWIGYGSVDDPPVFSDLGALTLVDDVLAGRNWTIRGYGTGGAPCLVPSDVPWLSVTPASGSVAGGENIDIQIVVDMSGQGAGDFEAHLCIETNDADLPVMVVPVEVSVAAGDLAVDVSELDFDILPVGSADTLSFEVSNSGPGGASSIEIDTLTTVGDAEFSITGGDCALGTVLEPGESCTVAVSFEPTTDAAFTGQVEVGSSGVLRRVDLYGEGIVLDPAELSLSETSVDFGAVMLGNVASRSLVLSNVAAEGAADLSLSQIQVLVGGNVFAVDSGDCGTSLAAQESCTVEISFAPTGVLSYSGVLRIVADGQSENVALAGQGEQRADPVFHDRFEAAPQG